MSDHLNKLQLGWERLQKADNDSELLGYALVSFHGALENYFRDWLATNNSLDFAQRERVQDPQQVQWKELLDLIQQYRGLSAEDFRRILNANKLRQEVANGNRFQGTRADVEVYGQLVQQLITSPGFATPPASGFYAPHNRPQGSGEISKVFDTLTTEINRLDRQINPTGNNRLPISYILCGLGFVVPIGGLHRLYNGQIGTGLLWLCTFGLFYVGQFVDLFLLPGMVEEYKRNLRAQAGVSSFGVPLNHPVVASQVHPPKGNELMIRLIEVAESRGGSLTVTQGVKATGASFAEVETALKEMFKSGYVKIDNDPVSGAVTYYFHELD
ncbi:MAG TPA: TM2 domain-containing protein [Trichormus sp. M33_DOE_039]|nr:TM2 domain-containing protein [Trichormus sp. M33_DOE_039]